MAKEMGIQSIIVIGDSKIIICYMVHNSKPGDLPLAPILDWTKQESSSFSSINFYHVLRELNKEADIRAKLLTIDQI